VTEFVDQEFPLTFSSLLALATKSYQKRSFHQNTKQEAKLSLG